MTMKFDALRLAACGAAPTSRTCCIELVAPKPMPQIATPIAITGSVPAPSDHTVMPVSTKAVASSVIE